MSRGRICPSSLGDVERAAQWKIRIEFPITKRHGSRDV